MKRDLTENAARLLRPSLRANAVLTVLAMLVLPQIIVAGWSLMERDLAGKLQWETRVTAEQAATVLEGSRSPRGDSGKSEPNPPAGALRSPDAALLGIASQWGTRIRVVDETGREIHDADADRGTDLVHQIGTLFFGPDGAPTLREYDETLGPVHQRPEVAKVTGWREAAAPRTVSEGATYLYPFGIARAPDAGATAPVSTLFRAPDLPSGPLPGEGNAAAGSPERAIETSCRTSPGAKLLVCHAALRVDIEGRPHVVYAQGSSRRAVRALYDLRYHLARLSVVMLPFALVFSWWMGRRMVRPIEWLRGRVLEKAKSANPRADIELGRVDEVGDLAKAFNDLLGALDDKRKENEAFVADLVHEFKNPVAAIRACAEGLEGGAPDEKRASRYAKILADSSGRLDALVSQFLELARAEAGLANEERSDVDVAALARGVTVAMESRYPAVVFTVDTSVSVVVHGVATRLDSVIRNLVDNAASFAMPRGDGVRGRVTIVVRREVLAGGSARAVIEVSDSGPGISATDLPRVFDRFFSKRARRAQPNDGASAREPTGTGLGLALVKAIADAHGGEASARSVPGEGATFRVVLPAVASSVSEG